MPRSPVLVLDAGAGDAAGAADVDTGVNAGAVGGWDAAIARATRRAARALLHIAVA